MILLAIKYVLLQICLLFTNPQVGVIALSICYVLCDNHIVRIINIMFVVVFIGVTLNTWLKGVFMVPLHISLKNPCWWSFPSGHVQYGVIFSGMIWINNKYDRKILLFLLTCLVAAMYATEYYQYHTWSDIFAAIPSALLMLVLYYYLLSGLKQCHSIDAEVRYTNCLNIGGIICQCIGVSLIPSSPCPGYKLSWLWLDIGLNIGFVTASAVQMIFKDMYQQLMLPSSIIQFFVGVQKQQFVRHATKVTVLACVGTLLMVIILWYAAKTYKNYVMYSISIGVLYVISLSLVRIGIFAIVRKNLAKQSCNILDI